MTQFPENPKIDRPDRRTGEFYVTSDEAEARRLELMAGLADPVSLAALRHLPRRSVLLDVGAGDSVTLGQYLRQNEIKYVAVDMRPEAIAKHRAAGFEDSEVAFSNALPFEDASFDASFSRFVDGWSGPEAQLQKLGEMLRVSKDTLGFVEYDWGPAYGPPPVQALLDRLKAIVTDLGFDPTCGADMPQNIDRMLTACGFGPQHRSLTTETATFEGTVGQFLPIMEAHVAPLLNHFKDKDPLTFDEITRLWEDVIVYAAASEANFQARMRLPDMVSVVVRELDPLLHKAAVMDVAKKRALGEAAVLAENLRVVGPPELEVFEFSGPFRDMADRFHTETFKRYITDDGWDLVTGRLSENINPRRIVERSMYMGKFENGEMAISIRRVGGPLEELPTIEKVREIERCLAVKQGREVEILAGLPFMDAHEKVFEGSALGRLRGIGNGISVSKLFVAIICEAAREGYTYGVVSLVDHMARSLGSTYGQKAFERIGGEENIAIKLGGPEIRPEGVVLIPYYIRVATFLRDCLDHFENELAKNPQDTNFLALHKLFTAGYEFQMQQSGGGA